MEKQPEVSVIMPVYNGGAFLAAAIESLLNQTLSEFELIIIDDCSNDNSAEIIKSFTDSRIVYHRHQKNSGVVGAMNTGLTLAQAPYIAVMHADDLSYQNRLALQKACLDEHQETAVVAGYLDFIDEQGNRIGEWELDRRKTTRQQIRNHMPWENCIAHSSVMMRRDVVKQYGYDTSQQKKGYAVEDYPLWLTILSDGHVIDKIPESVLGYRKHAASATTLYLRTQNPFFINYYTKKTYLQQRRAKGYTAFDYLVWSTMQLDYIKAHLKTAKRFILKKKHVPVIPN